MPIRITSFESTPNPNALKCVVESPIVCATGAPRSFFSSNAAQADPIGAAIFSVPGVTNVLIAPGWITVSKKPDAEWKLIKPALKKILAEVKDG